MLLEEVEQRPYHEPERSRLIEQLIAREENYQRWVEHAPSTIIHHDADCCDEARLWFLSYARSMEVGASKQFDIKAPTWIHQMYKWGPSEWPISWCRLVKEKVLDCGAFAALAREVFAAQGHVVHPAQGILSYNELCTRHWKDMWQAAKKGRLSTDPQKGETFPWIGTDVVYHELCLLELPTGDAKLYDSTWGTWYEPYQRLGWGALLAFKTDCPRVLRWADRLISCGEWIDL